MLGSCEKMVVIPSTTNEWPQVHFPFSFNYYTQNITSFFFFFFLLFFCFLAFGREYYVCVVIIIMIIIIMNTSFLFLFFSFFLSSTLIKDSIFIIFFLIPLFFSWPAESVKWKRVDYGFFFFSFISNSSSS